MCMLSMNHFAIPRRPILNLEYVYTYIVLRNKVECFCQNSNSM